MGDYAFERNMERADKAVMTPLFEPNVDAIKAIPMGAEVVAIDMGEGAAISLHWDDLAREAAIVTLTDPESSGRYEDNLWLYVDPSLLKATETKES